MLILGGSDKRGDVGAGRVQFWILKKMRPKKIYDWNRLVGRHGRDPLQVEFCGRDGCGDNCTQGKNAKYP